MSQCQTAKSVTIQNTINMYTLHALDGKHGTSFYKTVFWVCEMSTPGFGVYVVLQHYNISKSITAPLEVVTRCYTDVSFRCSFCDNFFVFAAIIIYLVSILPMELYDPSLKASQLWNSIPEEFK